MAVLFGICGQTVNVLRIITLLHVIAQLRVTAREGSVTQTDSNNQSHNYNRTESHPYMQPIWVLNAIITPSICVFGIIGNFMNLLILTHRRLLATDGHIEESAYCGMAALAMSDFAYCVVALIKANTNTEGNFIFNATDIGVYIIYIQTYLQNLLSYVSTWFTVVITVGRYVAICHPIRARFSIFKTATKIAIAVVLVAWVGLCLPDLWHYDLVRIEASANHSSLIFLDQGALYKHPKLHIGFGYIWHVLGFIVPVITMSYCNIQLIRALRRSRRLREEHGNQPAAVKQEMSLTATLVLIVLLFFILVSPSEILHFSSFLVGSEDIRQHDLLTAITNALNTLNFATNFLLYLGVNVHFRRTLRQILRRTLGHILCRHRVSVEKIETATRVYRFTSTNLWCSKYR